MEKGLLELLVVQDGILNTSPSDLLGPETGYYRGVPLYKDQFGLPWQDLVGQLLLLVFIYFFLMNQAITASKVERKSRWAVQFVLNLLHVLR